MTTEERAAYMKKWNEKHEGYAKTYYSEHKEHMNEQTEAWQKKHPEIVSASKRKFYIKHRAKVRLNQKEYWVNGGKTTRHRKQLPVKDFVNRYKVEHGCSVCGVKGLPPECYDFHHVDPTTKIKDLGHIAHSNTIERAKIEMAKCIVLCANCHRIVEGNIRRNAHEV